MSVLDDLFNGPVDPSLQIIRMGGISLAIPPKGTIFTYTFGDEGENEEDLTGAHRSDTSRFRVAAVDVLATARIDCQVFGSSRCLKPLFYTTPKFEDGWAELLQKAEAVSSEALVDGISREFQKRGRVRGSSFLLPDRYSVTFKEKDSTDPSSGGDNKSLEDKWDITITPKESATHSSFFSEGLPPPTAQEKQDDNEEKWTDLCQLTLQDVGEGASEYRADPDREEHDSDTDAVLIPMP